ncbi:MAG: Ku protein [Phycisphaerales bacterium]|nr:Ku protein [Phycisphaerales bacterium]
MPRSLWSGHIAFGLVNVPVRLVSAVRDKSIHFHMLSKDGSCRLRRKLYCPETGDEFDFKDTSRGYEIAPDQYVIVREDEFEKIRPETGRTIDIEAFIDLKEVDPVFFDRTYFLLPGEGGAKGYRLLVEAMASQERVGVARFSMRQREHLAALRVMENRALALHTMHYADEIASWSEMEGELALNAEVTKKETEMARQLIDSLTEAFEPGRYQDRYRAQLQELIEAKAHGEEIVTAPSGEEEAAPVYNIMEALKQSLEKSKPARKSTRPAKTAKSAKRRRAS